MDLWDNWDFLDCTTFIEDIHSPDFLLSSNGSSLFDSLGYDEIEFSASVGDGSVGMSTEKEEKEGQRKRVRGECCSRPVTKASREKLRRERLNERFFDLSSVLEPRKPVKTDKPAILDDAIRVLTQLRNESQELKETNEKLLEEIKNLKVEKNELREEKLVLKADNERTEQQLKSMAFSSPGYVPTHPAAYQNKMAVYPSYGFVPMWNYLPTSLSDTSLDHELRPPAA